MDFATLKLVGDTSGLKPIEPALDAVVAKAGKAESAVKKLGTSTTAMGTGARKAAADAKTVSTALDAIEADARQAEAALRSTQTALNGVGMRSNVAAGSVSNLGAQVFDIGMMMQAGQNPFQLMLQQGSQVAQVMGPMGAAGAVAALKATFVSLLNPVNLAVFAIIGGTAALVQWASAALSAGEETLTFREQVDALQSSVNAVNEITKVYSSDGLQSLKDKYGEVTTEILAMVEAQKQFTIAVAMEDARAAAQSFLTEYGEVLAMVSASEEAPQRLTDELGLSVEQALQLRYALSELRSAQTFEEQAAALGVMNGLLAESKIATSEVAGAGLDAEAAMRELAASAPSADWMSSAISGVFSLGEAIRGRIAEAYQLKGLAAAGAGAFKPGTYTEGGMDAAARGVLPGAGITLSPTGAGLPSVPSAGGGGGGGGGGGRSAAVSEAEKQAQAIDKVVTSLRSEIAAIGATGEARRLQQELQKAGVTIYSEEGQAIATLVEELTALEAKQKLVSETLRGIESAAEGFFVGVLSGAKDLKSAIGDVLKQLGDLFLNQAFKMLWGGASAGGSGAGLGSFLGFMDTGGRIQAGQIGIVGEKRPEFVDGKLVTRPTLIEGPANVTGGAATGRLLDRAAVPGMQVAQRKSTAMQMPAPRVTVQPPQVVVLDDPRKIDAFMRSPAGERSASRQQRRLGSG